MVEKVDYKVRINDLPEHKKTERKNDGARRRIFERLRIAYHSSQGLDYQAYRLIGEGLL